MTRGLLIAGTTSDAGKSLVTAGVCRMLARAGISVAPFKSQNMSNNSMVCGSADGSPGGSAAEIGRAQWLQAVAAGVVPEPAMNPVLLKPGSDRRSHIVLMGQPAGTLEAGEFATGRAHLAAAAYDAFRSLASRYDVVVAEGAGSPAEVNLRTGDYVNMGLAREMGLPVVVVGDIDRGGVLAAMYGTLAMLDDADQALIRGWLVNKFRGDVTLLNPGLEVLEERTGRPVLGVLPWLDDVWLDSEDALAIGGISGTSVEASLRVAVIRLPRISNATDIDALASEPAVDISFTAQPVDVSGADLVVLPGSRATVSDLAWLRARGLDRALAERVAAGRPVLGICGGYQMLARSISDPAGVESGGVVDGLGLLPTTVGFGATKQLGLPRGAWRGHDVSAYAIHHGVATLADGAEAEPFLDGWSVGPVFGTTWHGAFENDDFRRAFLGHVATLTGSTWAATPGTPSYAARREAMVDRLADALEEHVGLDAVLNVIDGVVSTTVAAQPARPPSARPPVRVVGIGADGWAGVAPGSRAAIEAAGVVVGGQRQLDLLPTGVKAERVAWPSPLRPSVRPLVERHAPRGLVVLASGDPMWHGIGRTLLAEVGADYDIEVLPHPGSVSLACARLGWPVEQTTVVSLLTQPADVLRRHLHDGALVLVLSRDESTPAEVAAVLADAGFGDSSVTVLGDLGSLAESIVRGTSGEIPRLNVVAVECVGKGEQVTPGLPDEGFEHDGQLTKREIRAVTLSALAPRPGELLWDVGGGAGSIAIEWLRAAHSCRAIAIEQDRTRADRITKNAAALGVPSLEVVVGSAPAALEGLEAPDVVFVGGGLTTDGVLDAAWAALKPGGRLVANAVTLESQADLVRYREKLGGTLTRLEVARSTEVGRFTGWRPAMPVVQWSAKKVSTGSTTERQS
nr:cobyric acid synthase [Nocardioides speluncae]